MTTLLPKDADNNPIPALRLKDDSAHSVAIGVTSARNNTAFDSATQIISLYATAACYVRLGNSSVTATTSDHYFPAGVYYDIAISGGDGKSSQDLYIAVIRASEDGTLYISEKE